MFLIACSEPELSKHRFVRPTRGSTFGCCLDLVGGDTNDQLRVRRRYYFKALTVTVVVELNVAGAKLPILVVADLLLQSRRHGYQRRHPVRLGFLGGIGNRKPLGEKIRRPWRAGDGIVVCVSVYC